MKSKGFSLVEVLVVFALVAIIGSFVVSSLRSFEQNAELQAFAQELINTLRSAQNKTTASESASQYGVYFDISTNPQRLVLFKGSAFATRDEARDEIHILPDTVELSSINLTDGSSEVVFQRIGGALTKKGSIALRLKKTPSKVLSVSVDSSGTVMLAAEPSLLQGPISDSRHVHIDYSRNINTASESLILEFDGGAVREQISISSNISKNLFLWEGEVNVSGSLQKLKIETHRLNNPDTQISVKRDRSVNDKSLRIKLSGESGILIEYSADGLTTTKTSIYASDPAWQ